ncbi:hypothetical protein QYM36_008755 [Artemia franciscana]|uniref:Uncharacterized protein n=1 Tax=Artemia franciscana TaxID=6661 RepID=A0AA88HY11_ARTSF|nr:hypothetical protein QYM36_008755 [Artemia franciscana]
MLHRIVGTVFLFALVCADDFKETPRFGFGALAPDGTFVMKFNRDSLKFSLLITLLVLVASAIVLPLLGLIGLDRHKFEEEEAEERRYWNSRNFR